MPNPIPNDSQGSQDSSQGKSDGKPEDNQTDDANIKALQRKLTEKDKALKTLQAELDQKNDQDNQQNQAQTSELVKMQEQIKEQKEMIAKDREDRKVDLVKANFPKYSENLIRLLLRDKEGNIEEVESALGKQSENLGLKTVETPSFTPETAQEKIEEIKKNNSLPWDERLYQIQKIKDQTKKQ